MQIVARHTNTVYISALDEVTARLYCVLAIIICNLYYIEPAHAIYVLTCVANNAFGHASSNLGIGDFLFLYRGQKCNIWPLKV